MSIEINKEKCKGCRLCIKACPKKIISMSKELNSIGAHFAEIKNKEECIECGQCFLMCPEIAIKIIKKEKNE